jgi:hypothetical protein
VRSSTATARTVRAARRGTLRRERTVQPDLQDPDPLALGQEPVDRLVRPSAPEPIATTTRSASGDRGSRPGDTGGR